VADLEVTDQRRDSGQQWYVGVHCGVGTERCMGGRGADPHPVIAPLDALQFVWARDVDEVVEKRRSHCEHRCPTLTACQDLGFVPKFGEQFDGVARAARAMVGKRGGLHERPRAAAEMLGTRSVKACGCWRSRDDTLRAEQRQNVALQQLACGMLTGISEDVALM
jgi:hypothetical protein